MTRRLFLSQAAYALRKNRVDDARRIVAEAVQKGEVRAAAFRISSAGDKEAIIHHFGAATSPNTVFLLASITKPMTAAAVMKLVDDGAVRLDQTVRHYIPEFTGGGREKILVKQLLTHSSGLPDMLPDNEELRKRHAPLSEFVKGTCKVPLLFPPGTQVKYQSMGILMASEIAQRITGKPFREYIRQSVFSPLGMKDTSLGLGGRRIADTALCQVEGNDDWNWNSPYWRDLGVPWGGAHSTVADVAKFLEYFWEPDSRMLKPATAASMIVDHNQGLNEPRGIGFMVKPGSFGKSCSPRTYGHYGSTGTVAWADPARKLSFVLLTTKPADSSRASVLGPASDAASDAIG